MAVYAEQCLFALLETALSSRDSVASTLKPNAIDFNLDLQTIG